VLSSPRERAELHADVVDLHRPDSGLAPD
jgi:hypothetical protein